jgi:hypothetical protein
MSEEWHGRQILTYREYTPIPDRRWDWYAYLEGSDEETGLRGWGRTEQEAINDLISELEADDE